MAIDSQPLDDTDDLLNAMERLADRDTPVLTIHRDGRPIEVEVEVK